MNGLSFWERLRLPDYTNPEQVRHGTIRFDYSKCNGCFLCRASCPADAISKKGDQPFFKAGISECIFCGNCRAICPRQAIALESPYRYSLYFKTIDHLGPKPPAGCGDPPE